MIKKLKDDNYIELGYDKASGKYITQVKDKNGNEIDYHYDGNPTDAAYTMKSFIREYGGLLNEETDIDKIAKKKAKETKKKTKGYKLNPLSTFVLPDYEVGISKFNQHMGISDLSSTTGSTNCGLSAESKIVARANAASAGESSGDTGGGEASGGMGESLKEGYSRSWYIAQMRNWGCPYNFDGKKDSQVLAIYYKELEKQKELQKKKNKVVEKPIYTTEEDDNDITFDGDSYWKDGVEFEDDKNAEEFFNKEGN